MLVTRIALSKVLNTGKLSELAEQARRLGQVRSLVWRQFGSVGGAQLSCREVRDRWMRDGNAATFRVLANAWKETVRDAVKDIAASRAAAKQRVRKAIHLRTSDESERRRLYAALRFDTWQEDPWLSRQMRKHWKRGRNHTHNQIVVRSDKYRTFTLNTDGDVWLSIPGLRDREHVKVPLNTTVAPSGTLRLILRDGLVEIHHQIDASSIRSSHRPSGQREIGIDKGYTEVLTDSDGIRHGAQLGSLITARSDRLSVVNARRAKLRALTAKAALRGDRAKVDRIRANNLGTVKKRRQTAKWEARVRTVTFESVHAVVDKASSSQPRTSPGVSPPASGWERR
ncbi:hypothetical protein GCM10029992_56460 [Glycomyces albus]